MKYFLPILISASLFIEASQKKSAPPPSLVTTTAMTKGTINPLQTYVGTLYYGKKSELASEFGGVVSKVLFDEGDTVLKDTVLIKLDSKVLQANIDAKKSSLKAIEADISRQTNDLERTNVLFERNSVSKSTYEQSFYSVEKLHASANTIRNELKAMNTQLKRTSIKVPFNSVVVTRNVEVGEWVGIGDTIAKVVDINTIEAHINIPAKMISILKTYKTFTATIGKHEMEVTLKSVIPMADVATRTVLVKLDVPKGIDFVEGMRINVKIPILKKRTSFMTPRDAVIKRFGQSVVFAAVDGVAVMIPVQVIGYNKNLTAIKGKGLVENMRIVTKGNERIFPNMPILEKK